jgi:hypothetical protein
LIISLFFSVDKVPFNTLILINGISPPFEIAILVNLGSIRTEHFR